MLLVATILTFVLLPKGHMRVSAMFDAGWWFEAKNDQVFKCFQMDGYGTLEINSTLVLASTIPFFNGPATWSNREMTSISTCTSDGFCTTVTLKNYEFSSNISGTFVTISPLLQKDDQMMWTCFFRNKTESYTIIIKSTTTYRQIATESTIAPTIGLISIVGKGTLEDGSELILSCIIPTFTGFATWGRGNTEYTICTPDLCSTVSKGNYTFASNTAGIFATIYPLSRTENGTIWICYHKGYTISYTVFVRPRVISKQDNSRKSFTLSAAEIALIIGGSVIATIFIVLIIWFCLKRRF